MLLKFSEEFSFEIIGLFSLIFESEKGDVKSKTEALKKVIIMILNGEKLPGLLMTIIRFVLPLQDHTIKKLLLVFWEIVPKTTPDGRLLHEMIDLHNLSSRALSRIMKASPSPVILLVSF